MGALDAINGQIIPSKWTFQGNVIVHEGVTLSNGGESQAEITFDYERAEGGLPFVKTSQVVGDGSEVEIEVVFSETYAGLDKTTGDGPFFLFSNAMDSYRVIPLSLKPSSSPVITQFPFAQRSQRYQKVILRTPNSSIRILSIGYTPIRQPNPTINTFKCSNEKLNKIWTDGVRTVDMCTVEAGETAEAWEVTEMGTRIHGQHWAPCRYGTRWGDKIVDFEVKIEKGGASWAVHMVANGLIFCLDTAKRSLGAFEGLSNKGSVFPSIPRGHWDIQAHINLTGWIEIRTIAKGLSVIVYINDIEVGSISELNLHPLLGGSDNNTGSVAFGGPQNYIAVYRSLQVTDLAGHTLYQNSLFSSEKDRTLADFAVGTNALACTIDGAKRDRALFGGDLFVMGRSIYYSTANMNAVLGSIKLLTSFQTSSGYLGNLVPIQAPLHTEKTEPPTYAFYSLSYALLLVVAINDYWMYCGDDATIASVFPKLENLMKFTQGFIDQRGLVVAPPPFQMDWYPMGGPIFGASSKINLAYYDALVSMSRMCKITEAKDTFSASAAALKEAILSHLWNNENGILRMGDSLAPDGVCQDVNGYAITTGVVPSHSSSQKLLACKDFGLPPAFQEIERWDATKVVSPYASGFAAEALFSQNHGASALELVERIWGPMADDSKPNYSGGHWESLNTEGKPNHDDTSMMHGWSTWPVYGFPRYLTGLAPLEPGWTRWQVRPVLAGLENVDVNFNTPKGAIHVALRMQEGNGTGEVSVRVPAGTTAEVYAPEGWRLGTDACQQTVEGQNMEIKFRIEKTRTADHAAFVEYEKADLKVSFGETAGNASLDVDDQKKLGWKSLSIWQWVIGCLK